MASVKEPFKNHMEWTVILSDVVTEMQSNTVGCQRHGKSKAKSLYATCR